LTTTGSVEIWAQDSVSFNILDGGRKLTGPWIFFITSGLRGLIDLEMCMLGQCFIWSSSSFLLPTIFSCEIRFFHFLFLKTFLAILMDLCPSHLNISSLIQLVFPIPNMLFENKKTSIYLYFFFHLSPRKPWLKSLVSLPLMQDGLHLNLPSVINHLKDELQHFKRKSRSVIEYSHSFKALCDQLASMGSPTDETNKVH